MGFQCKNLVDQSHLYNWFTIVTINDYGLWVYNYSIHGYNYVYHLQVSFHHKVYSN